VDTYHEQDDGVGPVGVDILHQVNVGVVVIPTRDFVGVAVVVTAHLDDHQIGRLLFLDVPVLGLVAVNGTCARAGVGGAVPVPSLVMMLVDLRTECTCLEDIPRREIGRRNIAHRQDIRRDKPVNSVSIFQRHGVHIEAD
jgi:hypothetical protein